MREIKPIETIGEYDYVKKIFKIRYLDETPSEIISELNYMFPVEKPTEVIEWLFLLTVLFLQREPKNI